ncbi:MAG: ABC transporter ATP-binding protein [Oscillospiraceae bacterium]|jgi:putative ABC transport system ATP-binding protein|nr:ABC transporter ATP-binding protein [Oscillospiraceae bacterium]
MSLLELNNISYNYDGKKNVIKNVNYSFDKGKVYAITGRSGAGKTTLLSLLSGLTAPTQGEILFNNVNIKKINKYDFRSRYVGVIFQSFNLLPHLNSVENVELSMRASGKKTPNRRQNAEEILKKVCLDDSLAKRRILKLSGGEQQRVAIARAISYEPEIILADEPTGNLDSATQDEIVSIFKSLAHNDGKCVIIVTHSPVVAKAADEIFELAPLK